MKKKTILLMLALMFVSTNALSQNTIYGTVSGDIQAGITVKIYILSCGAPQPHSTLVTDSQGNYVTGGLPNGRYLVVPEDADYTFAPGSSWVDIPQVEIQPYDFTSLAVEPVQPIMPIAICEEAITDGVGNFTCNIGNPLPAFFIRADKYGLFNISSNPLRYNTGCMQNLSFNGINFI